MADPLRSNSGDDREGHFGDRWRSEDGSYRYTIVSATCALERSIAGGGIARVTRLA